MYTEKTEQQNSSYKTATCYPFFSISNLDLFAQLWMGSVSETVQGLVKKKKVKHMLELRLCTVA